jgi:class 3 adenylate cyclase
MKKLFSLLFIITVFLAGCQSTRSKLPEAKNGILDLSDWDFEKNGDVSLDGDWEFYWNKLYSPQDFQSGTLDSARTFLRVPGIWNSLNKNAGRLSGQGFGTYRLKIILHHHYDLLAVKILDASSSYKLWINKKPIVENGIVSSDPAEIKPQMLPLVKTFTNDSSRLELIIQVANNFHYKGGLWETIRIGTPEQLMILREGNIILSVFLAGTLFILFVYHLWIFLLRRTEKAALWFGILCICVFLRTFLINERVVYYLFPGLSLNIGYRMEYLTMFSVTFFYGMYFYYLFRNSSSKKVLQFIGSITIIEGLITIFAPTPYYTSVVIVFQAIIYLEWLYFFILTFKPVIWKAQGGALLLFSWIIVLICGTNDMLYLNMIINTSIVGHYAFFIFLVTQAYILSFKISEAFNQVEYLSLNLEHKVEERTRELGDEKKKSDNLLLNILPAEVAEELKQHGRSNAKTYGLVTVMFTDFKDFTDVSEKVSPELLVSEIDYCFSAFDNIIEKYGIEKIKTIGDAYICAGGLPVLTFTHAADTVSAAIEIRNFMLQRKKEKEVKGEIPFELRIGIHTGPVVAGIVGVKKFAYDIWGDTVNLAARMESSGEAGKINISGTTYALVKDKFNCTHRGKIQAKHKGEVDMYFVEPL